MCQRDIDRAWKVSPEEKSYPEPYNPFWSNPLEGNKRYLTKYTGGIY